MAGVTTGPRVDAVRMKRVVDNDPDLSYLGTYSDCPGKVHIDRKRRGDMGRGDMGRGEYRYFNLGGGDPEYIEQDYERAERYNAGDWCMMGVWAEADIVVAGVCQTIKSGGLWGVESDSGSAYFDEIKGDELGQLRAILGELGVAAEVIDGALADVDYDD